MLLVLEGPNGVGKSTVAAVLRDRLALRDVADFGRHWPEARWDDWRQLFASNVRRDLDVGAFSGLAPLLVERWLLSTMVLDGARGHLYDATLLRRLVVATRDTVKVFLLSASVPVIERRIRLRGEVADSARVRAQVSGYAGAAARFEVLGGFIRYVDAGRAPVEVADEICADW